ncbi:hypothetical protein TNCV_4982431 [Trichonephila clavipes]|nr:hypothetical protein TNCV_4982431 [Trichonephila clavipes]
MKTLTEYWVANYESLRSTVLPIVKPLYVNLLNRNNWTLQHDPASPLPNGNANKLCQTLENVYWSSSHSYLNPLSYKLWSVIEENVFQKRLSNLRCLKPSLRKSVRIEEIFDIQCPVKDEKPRETSTGTWKRRYSPLLLGYQENIIEIV